MDIVVKWSVTVVEGPLEEVIVMLEVGQAGQESLGLVIGAGGSSESVDFCAAGS